MGQCRVETAAESLLLGVVTLVQTESMRPETEESAA